MAILNQEQRTSMPLTFRSMRGGGDASLEQLIRRLLASSGQVVLVGRAGSGKSYAATDAALRLALADIGRMPVIVPASQWDGRPEVGAWFREYVEKQFNVSPGTSADLIGSQKVVPIIDGLDELEVETDSDREAAADFIDALLRWRELARPVPVLLTTRTDTWDALPEDLREHEGVIPYQIQPVSIDAVTAYISRTLNGRDESEEASKLVELLLARGLRGVIAAPWSAAMIARVAGTLRAAEGELNAELREAVVQTVSTGRLVSEFVQASLPSSGAIWVRLRCSIDVWRLSLIAQYLVTNSIGEASLEGQPLSSRNIVLHRFWPIGGRIKPRLFDFMLCALFSVPGFVWAFPFFWSRGPVARVSIVVGAALWAGLLVRTSTKAWVRPATPDWGRLAQPRVMLPQLGAALLIGIVATWVLSPPIGVSAFLTAWLAIGLTVGFGQTLTTDNQARVMGPEAVLQHEHTISRLSAIVVLPLLAAGFISTWGLRVGLVSALLYCLLVGELVASALWRRYVALIISSPLSVPLRPAAMLRRNSRLGLTRPSGLAYQFRHDDVRDHFAAYTGGAFSRVARRGETEGWHQGDSESPR
ncbi:NACHT domain-containing protein [Microlunatus spumicola]|uniref:NACHT domain-containing protein n=1 Tax=Microlunatus spumicola TaxID=81499 RepID=UPI003CD09797